MKPKRIFPSKEELITNREFYKKKRLKYRGRRMVFDKDIKTGISQVLMFEGQSGISHYCDRESIQTSVKEQVYIMLSTSISLVLPNYRDKKLVIGQMIPRLLREQLGDEYDPDGRFNRRQRIEDARWT